MTRIRNVEDPVDPQEVDMNNYVDTHAPSDSSDFAYIHSTTGYPGTHLVDNIWTKLACETTSSELSSFDTGSSSESNKLRYIGTPNITVNVTANICCTVPSIDFNHGNVPIFLGISIFKNGIMVPSSNMCFGKSNAIFSLTTSSFFRLVTNDFFEVYVLSSENTTIIPVDSLFSFLQLMVSQV